MFSRQAIRSVRAAAPQRALALRTTPVRCFAAAASADAQPPVAVFGVDGTYASALVRSYSANEFTRLRLQFLFNGDMRPFFVLGGGRQIEIFEAP